MTEPAHKTHIQQMVLHIMSDGSVRCLLLSSDTHNSSIVLFPETLTTVESEELKTRKHTHTRTHTHTYTHTRTQCNTQGLLIKVRSKSTCCCSQDYVGEKGWKGVGVGWKGGCV